MKCEECNGELTENSSGFYACGLCGLCVEGDIIFERKKDYMVFNSNISDQKNHYGAYILHSTPHISVKSMPLKNLKFKRYDFKRIVKLSVETLEIRKFIIIFKLIKRICIDLNIEYLYQHCCYLFKKIQKFGEFRGRGKHLFMYAVTTVYFQCRFYKLPYFYRDFYRKYGLKKKYIFNVYKVWKGNIKIKSQSLKLWMWKFLDFYLNDSEMKLKIKLYRNIDKICKKDKFWDLNTHILSISCFYALMKKFKYIKISQNDIYKNFGIQYISIWRYLKLFKSITL